MNIFATSRDPEKAALDLQDIHKKMILESAQLLSTAHVQLDGVRRGYGATHINHPSAIWVRDLEIAYHEREMIANDAFRRSGSLELAKSKYEIATRRFNLAIEEVRNAAGAQHVRSAK